MPQDENIATPDQSPDSSAQNSQVDDSSQGNVGGSDPTNQNTQQVVEPKMIEAERFNKLQSHYQNTLKQVREFEGKQQYYQQLEQELRQLRAGTTQQPQAQATQSQQGAKYRPDMSAEDFAAELKKEFMGDLQTQAQRYYQEQNQMKEQQVQQARVEKYNDRFDQVRSHDPDVDQDALQQWMQENDVWNPIVAYNNVYAEVLAKANEGKMRQEVSEKISKNAATRVEGNNRQGTVPPQEADISTKDAREKAFINMLQGQP